MEAEEAVLGKVAEAVGAAIRPSEEAEEEASLACCPSEAGAAAEEDHWGHRALEEEAGEGPPPRMAAEEAEAGTVGRNHECRAAGAAGHRRASNWAV